MDYVIRYEFLSAGLEHACDVIGLPADIANLPKLKAGKKRDYKSYYSPCDRARVERIAGHELEIFGYEY